MPTPHEEQVWTATVVFACLVAALLLIVVAAKARGDDVVRLPVPVERVPVAVVDVPVSAERGVEIVADADNGEWICVVRAGADIGREVRPDTNAFAIAKIRGPARLAWLHSELQAAGKCATNCPGLRAHIGASVTYPVSYDRIEDGGAVTNRVMRRVVDVREARRQMRQREEITNAAAAFTRGDLVAVPVGR